MHREVSVLSPDRDEATARRLAGWLDAYRPLSGIPDELIGADGQPRPHWRKFLLALAEFEASDFAARVGLATRRIRDAGVSHRIYGEANERTWPLSPLPLILGESEWSHIAAGVAQRAELLEWVLRDLYGEGTLVGQGHLPAAAVTGSGDFVRALRGYPPPGGQYMHLYAVDLGRGPDGRWWVLDDRAQAPSGAGYALENRMVLSGAFPELYGAMNVQRLAPFFSAFRAALADSAHRSDPRICLLTPGPFSETYFEQARLARYLGFLLVEGDDLVVREGQAYVRTIAGLKRADVIWRRVDADFIDPLELNSASRLGVPGLLEALRAGGVVVSNAPGAGLIESRALLSFLPALSRHLFGRPLLLPNVATWWCGQARERALVEQRMDCSPWREPSARRATPPSHPGRGCWPISPPPTGSRCAPPFRIGRWILSVRKWSGYPRPQPGATGGRDPARSSFGSMQPRRQAAGRSCPAGFAGSPISRTPAPFPWGRARAPATSGCCRTGRSNRSPCWRAPTT